MELQRGHHIAKSGLGCASTNNASIDVAVTALAKFKAYFLFPLDAEPPSFLNCKEWVYQHKLAYSFVL